MASAKQIKARKLFAKRVKRGDFRKAISKTKKANMGKKYTAKDVDEFNLAMEKKGIDEQMRFDAINKKFPNYFTDSGKKIEYEKITKIKL